MVKLEREATIMLDGPIDTVFPLFEPINEKLWVKGWDPQILYPPDGAMMEQLVFTTKARFAGEDAYRWVVTRYDPQHHKITYCVSANERIWFINVSCNVIGKLTSATIVYSYIALNEHGHELNQKAIEMMFSSNLRDWQDEINTYLMSSGLSNKTKQET